MVATNNLKYILNNDRKNLCTRNDEPWSSNTMVSGYFGDDGTLYVSTSGAITANSNLYFADSFILQAGVEYKFGLCSGSGPVRLALTNANGEWVANQFGSIPSTYTPSTTGTFNMYVYLYSGTNVTNHPITPMIYPTAVWDYDATYVQPARTNAELTVLEASDRAALAEEIDAGAKNKFDISTATFDTYGGTMSVTYNSESSATIKQVSGGTGLRFPGFITRLEKGTYILSGCQSGGSSSTYRLDVRSWSGSAAGDVVDGSFDYGSGSDPFTITTAGNYIIAVRLASGYTTPTAGITVQPMICTKAAFGVSSKFVPYRPNWDLVLDYIKAKLINTSDVFTANTNFTLIGDSCIYIQGNHVFGQLIVQKTNDPFTDGLDAIGTLKTGYRPLYHVIQSALFNGSQWGVNDCGYCYINTSGAVNVKTSSMNSSKYDYVNIPIDYIIDKSY